MHLAQPAPLRRVEESLGSAEGVVLGTDEGEFHAVANASARGEEVIFAYLGRLLESAIERKGNRVVDQNVLRIGMHWIEQYAAFLPDQHRRYQ